MRLSATRASHAPFVNQVSAGGGQGDLLAKQHGHHPKIIEHGIGDGVGRDAAFFDGPLATKPLEHGLDPRHVHRVATDAPELRIALAIESVVHGQEPPQVVPVRTDTPVREGAIPLSVGGRPQTAEENAHLHDDHVERRRFERLHETVGVPDGNGVAFQNSPWRPLRKRTVQVSPIPGFLACISSRAWSTVRWADEDVAAMILALDRDPPAPSGVHRLRRRIRLDRAALRHRGNDRGVAKRLVA